MKCWGGNAYGELGLGDTARRGDSAGEMGDSLPAVDLGTATTITLILAGPASTCIRRDEGNLKCGGFNDQGQLGLGDTNDRGTSPTHMGDNLPPVKLYSDVW
ncbi:BNR repeat domain protein [Chondromyces apiculatus DSM 436]|uniref:BNR repeat domain protein n=1 Tax=Chondromyces apiculatus DSM 436 TaxID=1192034 RepID=A0A017SYJ6_9BACT|nr:BNR repeat domain protein [Chondromyces apiculatus DSM 436]